MEAISLDHIDTTAALRVETERPIMDLVLDWLEVDLESLEPEEVTTVGEGEVEEEEEEVTPSRRGSSRGQS